MIDDRFEPLRSLLEGPSPAVLTTYRGDGSAVTRPVWFRWRERSFEVVIAEGDGKLAHLARDPRCSVVVFEAVPPFRGIEAHGDAQLVRDDPEAVAEVRADIAARYLGSIAGRRFTAQRASTPGVLLRVSADDARVWDLSRIVPSSD